MTQQLNFKMRSNNRKKNSWIPPMVCMFTRSNKSTQKLFTFNNILKKENTNTHCTAFLQYITLHSRFKRKCFTIGAGYQSFIIYIFTVIYSSLQISDFIVLVLVAAVKIKFQSIIKTKAYSNQISSLRCCCCSFFLLKNLKCVMIFTIIRDFCCCCCCCLDKLLHHTILCYIMIVTMFSFFSNSHGISFFFISFFIIFSFKF